MTYYQCKGGGNPFKESPFNPTCLKCKPVVVINPGESADTDLVDVDRLDDLLWGNNYSHELSYMERYRILQAALRELANPQPPKPDEPTGLGAVVEDAEGNPWVKTLPGVDDNQFEWIAGFSSNPGLVSYDTIDAVKVLSPGVPVE